MIQIDIWDFSKSPCDPERVKSFSDREIKEASEYSGVAEQEIQKYVFRAINMSLRRVAILKPLGRKFWGSPKGEKK